MAELKTVTMPLNVKNYPTWKLQWSMLLIKDGLWNIVNGTEVLAEDANADTQQKFTERSDRALAVIVLTVTSS